MTTKTQWMMLRRASVATAVGALALLGSTGTAAAQTYTPTPSANFSDATPEAGQTVAVSGNTVANSVVSITLAQPDGTVLVLGTTTANASGSFNLSITLPSTLANGSYVLAAVNGTTTLSSSAFAVSGATTQGDITPAQTTGSGSAPTAGGAVAPTQTTTLPVTGGESGLLAWTGAGFIVLGGAALIASKSRATTEPARVKI